MNYVYMLSLLCSLIIGCCCGCLFSFCTANLFRNYFFNPKNGLIRMIVGGIPAGLICFFVLKNHYTCEACGEAFQIHKIASKELSTQYVSQNVFLDSDEILRNDYLRKKEKNKDYIIKEYQDDYKCNNCQDIKSDIYIKSWDIDTLYKVCSGCGAPFAIHKVVRTEQGEQFFVPSSTMSRTELNQGTFSGGAIIKEYTSYFNCNQCGKEHKQTWKDALFF